MVLYYISFIKKDPGNINKTLPKSFSLDILISYKLRSLNHIP